MCSFYKRRDKQKYTLTHYSDTYVCIGAIILDVIVCCNIVSFETKSFGPVAVVWEGEKTKALKLLLSVTQSRGFCSQIVIDW